MPYDSYLDMIENFDPQYPTHTEDGIPIRKLYVSNLPPKTSRAELFSVFAQYGFIRSCWLRQDNKIPNAAKKSTYAFVTFSRPEDAHKALQAPCFEKKLKGRTLYISPADSWHQPSEEAISGRPPYLNAATARDGNNHNDGILPSTSSNTVSEDSQKPNVLDILNRDCLNHVFSFLPLPVVIGTERVSKRWRCAVQDYLQGLRMFKTLRWFNRGVKLTTAVLRHILQKIGPGMLRIHIDSRSTSLNDRTAHIIGKFCPNLEELRITEMTTTKNWNPVFYGCKHLKRLILKTCLSVGDQYLQAVVSRDSNIEEIHIENNAACDGSFLYECKPPKLRSITIYNVIHFKASFMVSNIRAFANLTAFKFDANGLANLKSIPHILKGLPKLEHLSLNHYKRPRDASAYTNEDMEELHENILALTDLKCLSVNQNDFITNTFLKNVAKKCTKLEVLNISSCNGRLVPEDYINDAGIRAICRGCSNIRILNCSELLAITDSAIQAISTLSCLQMLKASHLDRTDFESFLKCIQKCPNLEMLDICNSSGTTADDITRACEVLERHPTKLQLVISPIGNLVDFPTHRQLELRTSDWINTKLLNTEGWTQPELNNYPGRNGGDRPPVFIAEHALFYLHGNILNYLDNIQEFIAPFTDDDDDDYYDDDDDVDDFEFDVYDDFDDEDEEFLYQDLDL